MPGACYPALRRLPGRDLHPLEKRSVQTMPRPPSATVVRLRHDAPWRAWYDEWGGVSRFLVASDGAASVCASAKSGAQFHHNSLDDSVEGGVDVIVDSGGEHRSPRCGTGAPGAHKSVRHNDKSSFEGAGGRDFEWCSFPLQVVTSYAAINRRQARPGCLLSETAVRTGGTT